VPYNGVNTVTNTTAKSMDIKLPVPIMDAKTMLSCNFIQIT